MPEGISKRASQISPFHVMDLLARAKKLQDEGRDIIHLEVGEPDFDTPEPVISAAIAAAKQVKLHYTPATGLPELKQAVADYYKRRFGLNILPERVIITPGASGALQLILASVLDAGEEIIISDPGYPCNTNISRLLNAVPVQIPVGKETGFQLSQKHLEQYWSNKTRAVLVASPSNPTGTLINQVTMQQLIETTLERSGCFIVDEIYQGLVYGEQSFSALEFSDKIFIINSFSKYFGMTGWRLGWAIVPESHMQAVDQIAQNIFLAPCTLSQYAALKAFEPETQSVLESRRSEFESRRNFLIAELRTMGFKIEAEPHGAFYIYADCSAFANDSFDWVNRLLEEQGVAVTPGLDFGSHLASKHVRFAYTRPVDVLKQACERIQTFIKS